MFSKHGLGRMDSLGTVLAATDVLREKYDIDVIIGALMGPRNSSVPYFGKLSAKERSDLMKLVQESEALQYSLRRKKAGRSK